MKWRGIVQSLAITVAALLSSMALFGAFMAVVAHVSPVRLYAEMYHGAFGSRFSWQNTLSKAAPLILTALCTALPARLGLIVIGAEGALVVGGLAAVCAGLGLAHAAPVLVTVGMALAGMAAGGLAIALVGALSHGRGVNATISSLLLAYILIAIFNFVIEDPRLLRDPASLNKPSSRPVPTEARLGNIAPGLANMGLDLRRGPLKPLYEALDVHWGLAFGIVFCLGAYVLMEHTTFGFAARMAGGNVRAAQLSGLRVGSLIAISCFLGGAAAGLAGMVEVAAVQGQANASLMAGYGFTGILVSFVARHHVLAIIPTAVLFGGLSACSGVLQRRLHVPDASVQVLMGIIFVTILLFETFSGRFRIFQPRLVKEAA